METEPEIKPGMQAEIRGGTFKVVYLESPGNWVVEKIHGTHIRMTVTEAQVREGMSSCVAETIVKEVSRQESPEKDAARLKYLPRKAY